MLPIEDCLDKILEELKKSWDRQDRPKLNATSLLSEFGIPQDRHEMFKSLINKMVEDGYVDFIDKVDNPKSASLEAYEGRTMLTALGYYFIADKGYTEASKRKKSQKRTQNLKDWLLIIGTWLAGLGAIFLVAWEIYQKIILDSSN